MNKIKLILVGIIIILLISTTLAESIDSDEYHTFCGEHLDLEEIQPKTLDDAVAEIEQMIKDGEPRWEVAKRAAIIADVQIINNNEIMERMGISANWFSAYRDSKQTKALREWSNAGGDSEEYDSVAIWVWENRIGQCSENADLVYYLLKEAGVEDVRRHKTNRATPHGLVVWGMGNRDPSKPESWTDEVIIPDSWQHYVLRGEAAFNNRYAGCDYTTDMTQGKDSSACGYGGRPCCKKIDPCRFSALVCVDNKCRGCGYEGKYCCKDEKCNEGLECNKDGMCVKKEKDTSAGDNSGKEFTCPSPPKEAKHIVTNTADYWKMPDGKIIGQYQTWWDSVTAYPPHKGDKTRRLWLGCYNTEGKWQGVWKRWDRYGVQDRECNFNDGSGMCKSFLYGSPSRLGSICYKDGKQVECCRKEGRFLEMVEC